MAEQAPTVEDEARKLREQIARDEEWEKAQKTRGKKKPEAKKPDKKERKEKRSLLEKLNQALWKLKEITEKFPPGSWERRRAEHTLSSIESVLGKLGKDGA